MRRWIWLCLWFISAFLTGYAQEVREIHVEKPGTLADKIAAIEDFSSNATVKITGELYNSDFKAFQKWKGYVWSLDLSDAIIDTIPEQSFSGIDLKKVVFPSSLVRIDKKAFASCIGLKEIDLSPCIDLLYIGSSAFSACNALQKIDISACSKLKYLGDYVFSGCSKLKSIDLSKNENLKEINDLSFYGNISLSDVKLPPLLEVIGKEAFVTCKFQYLEIPASIKEIKWHAFVASKISVLKIDAVKPPLLLAEDDPFMQDGLTLIVPVGSKSLYEKAPVWSLYDIREVGLCFIMVKNNGGGSVKIGEKTIQSGEVSVSEATDVQVSFIPDEGYSLKQVKLGATDVTEQVKGNTLTIPKIVENKELTVVFEKEVYSVKVSYNEGGVVDVNKQDVTSGSSVLVDAGTDVKLGITPNEGFKLQQVLLGTDDVTKQVENGVLTISKISERKDVIVRFEKIETVASYTVKVTYNEGGTVQIGEEAISSGSSKVVTASEDITVSIIPKTGYHVKSVQLNKKDVTDKIENNKIVITSINADQELTVIFEVDTPKTCLVRVTYNVGGQVKINNQAATNGSSTPVTAGTDIQILMLPNDGYLLKQVKLGAADVTDQLVNNTLTIPEIAGDREVTVIFEKGTPATCSVKVSYSDGGMVKVNNYFIDNGISLMVQKSAKVSVAFIPDYGCYLKQVLLDGKDVTLKVVDDLLIVESVTSDLAIVAIFEKTPLVSCIVDVIGNGTVKVNGQTVSQSLETVSVEKGSAVTLSFTPDAKYKLGSVLLNNQNVIGQLMNNEYHIASLTSNLTCQVEFVLKDAPTGIDQPENATKRVYRSASRRLAIFGFEAGVPVYVYDGSGRLVVLKTIRDSMEEVEVPADGLYFVRIGKESFKVIL